MNITGHQKGSTLCVCFIIVYYFMNSRKKNAKAMTRINTAQRTTVLKL